MNRLIHIGFGNIVNTEKIVAVVDPDSAPIRRLIQNARDNGTVIDATRGRRTKSVLIMENSEIVLSALLPDTIAQRAGSGDDSDDNS
ncbi:MAG: DUF370 domain-containing protein [Lachnospiraceae bacterium]|nr:DUF370 domain-containing protein [Lachnospiraceae bacterium]